MTSHLFSPELQQLVQAELATGEYASQEELLLQAMRLLADRSKRRQELRQELQIARDQLDRGEGIELDGEEALEAFFDEIKAEVNAELAAERKSQ